MNQFSVVAATLVITAFITFKSIGQQNSPSTVKQCTSLLPSGYTFSMVIEAKIDTHGVEPVMSGQLHLTDGTEVKNAELGAQVEPFRQCVIQLMK